MNFSHPQPLFLSVAKAIDKLFQLFSEIRDNALDSFAENLQAVSFSGNKIAQFPATPLRLAKKLSHLNLGIISITHNIDWNFFRSV